MVQSLDDPQFVIEHVGREAGPIVALIGAVHGDEEEGVLAVQQVQSFNRAIGGWGRHVDDEVIVRAQRTLAELEGIFVEPAARALAGVEVDVASGRLGPSHVPVRVPTGSGFKDLSAVQRHVAATPSAGVSELSALIRAWVIGRDGTPASSGDRS